jgi:hypothetical protein
MCADDGLVHGMREAEVIGVDDQPAFFRTRHNWTPWPQTRDAATI